MFERRNQNVNILSTGIKVIGGVKELTGEEFGVYVKRILPGGLASSDGEYWFFFAFFLFFGDDKLLW